MTPAQVAHIMPPLPEKIMMGASRFGSVFYGYTADHMQAYARAAVEAALRDLAPLAEPKRCPYCDDTGHVHSIDGEWRGTCKCPAGQLQQAEGCDEYFKARPQLESAVNRGIFEAGSRAAVEAALRDAPQAEPTDAKDAARYRYLVVMETKAAPDTVAHYIRNPAHLDRVIEVMEQKP